MSRFDAQRSASSPEELPPVLRACWTIDLPRLKPAWSDQPRMTFDRLYNPIVLGTRVIVTSANDDSVFALDLKTGMELWRFFAEGPIRLPAAADDETLFVGSDDGFLYALHAATGELAWKMKGAPKTRRVIGNDRMIDTWAVRGGPVVADGQVYFAAGIWPFMGVFLHCLDAKTGAVIWTNSGDGPTFMTQPHGAKSFSGIAPQGSLAVSGNRLLVPNGRAVPACFDRLTGKMKHLSMANKFGGNEVAASPTCIFNGGMVFELENGKAVGTGPHSPVIADETALGITSAGLHSYDLTAAIKKPSLTKLQLSPSARFTEIASAPYDHGKVLIRAGSRIYVGGTESVAAFEFPLQEDAQPIWKLEVEGKIGYLAAASGHLLAVNDAGRIYCFSGTQKTSVSAPVAIPVTEPVEKSAPIRALLADAKIDAGYALVLGASSADLCKDLAGSTQMRVLCVEPFAARAAKARADFFATGLYGERLALLSSDLIKAALPPYFASLVISSDLSTEKLDEAWFAALFKSLHPYHGVAYLPLDAPQTDLLRQFVAARCAGHATVSQFAERVRLARHGGIPGAANWTHEHADAGNSRVSKDTVVKAPLGVLWFGGSNHYGILPRHGHGPQPQVIDGRAIVEGMDMLRAIDIYTGRVLWEATLPGVGSYFNNLAHHPGANGTGTNYVCTSDSIYVALGKTCVRLDPDTGAKLNVIELPVEAMTGPNSAWGYLNVFGDYLIGGCFLPAKTHKIPIPKQHDPDDDDDEEGDDKDTPHENDSTPLPRAICSQRLFVMHRKTGALIWRFAGQHEFRHNAVCAGGGKLFAIDRLSTPNASWKEPKPEDRKSGRVLAFDLATGKELWSSDDAFGTWLSYSEKFAVLVESGRNARDTLKDEPKGMRAFKAADGTVLWHDPKALGPAMIRGSNIIKEGSGADLLTGAPMLTRDPITGQELIWGWKRLYGCNTPSASEHLLTFRSGAAGFYDLARMGGTGNFGGFRSGCTNNLIVAGGVLCAPDYTRTCQCSYQIQTSLALVPDAETEMWTFYGGNNENSAFPIKHIGINLGAAGDRVDDHGTLWLEYPSSGGASPKLSITTEGSGDVFTRHASLITGPLPWVAASGMKNLRSFSLNLNTDPANAPLRYTVRLIFAEPDAASAGKRPMDILIQGELLASGLDVATEAGGLNRTFIKEFRGIQAGPKIDIELKTRSHVSSLLCGIEVIAE